MGKLILFSGPQPSILEKLRKEVFINGSVRVAYMPSDGANQQEKYEIYWKKWVEENDGNFVVIDNSLRGDSTKEESMKILESDVLIITGGNTFVLLNHLRESGLIPAVKQFAQTEGKTILGFSAGAIIMSPTIRMANQGVWTIMKLE